MKVKLIIFFILSFFSTKKIIFGEYFMYNAKIKLNTDYTFEYDGYSETCSFWTKGTWKYKSDTIYLTPILIYDTIRIVGRKDSLSLSCAKTPNLILATSYDEIIWPRCSGQQSNNFYKKLFYKNDKLLQIKQNGKLITKKRKKSFFIKEEYYNPWFEKKQ